MKLPQKMATFSLRKTTFKHQTNSRNCTKGTPSKLGAAAYQLGNTSSSTITEVKQR